MISHGFTRRQVIPETKLNVLGDCDWNIWNILPVVLGE